LGKEKAFWQMILDSRERGREASGQQSVRMRLDYRARRPGLKEKRKGGLTAEGA